MKCPVCGTWTLVKETRKRADNSKYRRYECANLHRFTTLETVAKVIVAKKTKD
jgi:transcriptional regulator NrdR family protein